MCLCVCVCICKPVLNSDIYLSVGVNIYLRAIEGSVSIISPVDNVNKLILQYCDYIRRNL